MTRMTPHYDEPGSTEWHERRNACFNASDAPAMLGCDPNRSRTDLLDELVKGFGTDASSFQQRVFDKGHRTEALARAIAEGIIGEQLNAIAGSREWPGIERPLGASFDGLTFAWDHAWEHKQMNAELADALPHTGAEGLALNNPANLPKRHRVQMEQQLMVSDALDDLFTVSDWDKDGNLVDERHVRYVTDPELRAEIVAGWKQLQQDLATHEPKVHAERPRGEKPEDLGALMVQVEGRIVTSNLGAWRDAALARIAGINRDLKTDDDFANAKATVTWLADSRKKLKLLQEQVLGQMVDVNEVITTLKTIDGAMKAAQGELDDTVTTRETQIRKEVADRGAAELAKHIIALTSRLGRPFMPSVTHVLIAADFQKAIKSKRTVKSLNDSVDSELSRAKIAASAVADRIELNLRHLAGDECKDWQHLFSTGLDRIVLMEAEQFQMHCKGKISEARDAEEKRRIQREQDEAALRRRQEEAEERRKAAAAAAAPPPPAPAAAPAPVAVPATVMQAPASTVRPAAGYPPVQARTPSPADYDVAMAIQPPVPAQPATHGEPTLKLGVICARLGIPGTGDGCTVSAAFLAHLGFEGKKDRGATLFHEEDYDAICLAFMSHVDDARCKNWTAGERLAA